MSDTVIDTLKHINTVHACAEMFIGKLRQRIAKHDQSKLKPPEKDAFEKASVEAKDIEYWGDEYKTFLKEMDEALKHHYQENSHHPEHFENGIDGMNLLDLIEMYCDWLAAVQRMKNGSYAQSLEINRERFGMSDQLYHIFLNSRDML